MTIVLISSGAGGAGGGATGAIRSVVSGEENILVDCSSPVFSSTGREAISAVPSLMTGSPG
jgi:hypothetical protein